MLICERCFVYFQGLTSFHGMWLFYAFALIWVVLIRLSKDYVEFATRVSIEVRTYRELRRPLSFWGIDNYRIQINMNFKQLSRI